MVSRLHHRKRCSGGTGGRTAARERNVELVSCTHGPAFAKFAIMSFAFLAVAVCIWMLVALSATEGEGGADGIRLKVRRERESLFPPGV
jgi:hypothetical protein